LKSVAGSLCGVSPLVADFNVEYKHHIYQPCLPQIFDVIGQIEHTDAAANFTSYPWKSTFMQSVTMGFDYNGGLLNAMGYHNIVDKEYLQSDNAKFGKVTLPDVNYFGFQEEPLLDYMRDEFEMAKENNGRVFISHLTSTSHHPYSLPSGETSVPLANGLDDLSKYMNAIGYDDRWLAKVLNMLEETGVANETLVVFVGDHGLSIPENGKLPSYYNPHTVINHIPMVFSHPSIPPISINSSVSAQQIVPTILDLLIETNSLSPPATKAAKDLVSNYEGQSLIRPTKETGESVRNWQFTIVNPGGAQIGIRDAFNKNFHLVIPAIDNVEWHFSEDPHDESVVVGFDFHDFLRQIEKGHGIEAAHWAEEAAFVGRWWVEENSKRWRYGPYATY
jgi:arylsulfatase A-like enzyme